MTESNSSNIQHNRPFGEIRSQRQVFRREILLAIGLAGVVFASRLLIDLPNFKPVMAVALLSGFLFSYRWLGLTATVAGMLASDLLIGFYDWRVASVVYLALALPMIGGLVLRRWQNDTIKLSTGIIGFAGLAAVNFYLLTTLAVWMCFEWYPATLAGLGTALLMGLPFLKWSMTGNIVFAVMLFGIVELFRRTGLLVNDRLPDLARRKPIPVPVRKQ